MLGLMLLLMGVPGVFLAISKLQDEGLRRKRAEDRLRRFEEESPKEL